MSVEALALAVSAFFTLASNRSFWQHLVADRSWAEGETWLLAACVFVAITAFQFSFLALPLTRRLAKPLLAVLLLATALASYFMQKYTVFLDPGMLRNALRTDGNEASELFSWDLLPHLAWQLALPLWLLWKLPLASHPWRRAALQRGLACFGGLAVAVLAVLPILQDFAAIARNQRELRFLVTPGNYVYSLLRLGKVSAEEVAKPLIPIGTDAAPGVPWAQRPKPLLLVLVVGETVRAANWGLNGYARQTTPELAALDVINFPDVTACGTNTEVSLPCMFAPVGRRDYDDRRIRTSQSLMHVLDRAGLRVLWRDNQSGCKGVCDGLPLQRLDALTTPGRCLDGRCFDEILLDGLDREVDGPPASRVVVLHQLGSHGPAYSLRYPKGFRKFQPTCETGELRKCEQGEIVNAYDNSVLYTDHFLAQTIRFLQSRQAAYDTALIYVSDHGESLGERNVYLHGLPWAIAPKEQTQVPMVIWLSPGFSADTGLDAGCLRRQAPQPARHDHLFHTVLGMLDVRTGLYEGELDITRPCRVGASVRVPGTARAGPAGPAPGHPPAARVTRRAAAPALTAATSIAGVSGPGR